MAKMNLIKKLGRLNAQIFPYLGTLIIASSVIESVSYTGIFEKYYHLSLSLFVLLGIMSALISVLFEAYSPIDSDNQLNQVRQNNSVFFLINKLALLVLVVAFALLNSIEKSHYPNYVFTTYHTNIASLAKPINISIVFLVTQILSQNIHLIINAKKNNLLLKKSNRKQLLQTILFVIIVMLTAYYSGKSLINTAIITTSSNNHILSNINATYDDKMRDYWPGMYDYMLFIKHLTPDSATILIPPQQSPWLTEGNAGLIRYFLYPRRVINGNIDSISDTNYDYVMIARGSWTVEDESMYGWPKISIKAKNIWYWDDSNRDIFNVSNTTYIPGETAKNRRWGLIQVEEK